MRIVSFCLFFLAALAAPGAAPTWEGEVVRVCDGDTIIVARTEKPGGREEVRVRLHGVDTPECAGRAWDSQPYCKAARRFVAGLLSSGSVAVMDLGVDAYGRTIGGVVSLPDGAVVQEELLKAGLAWVYTKYCRECRQWRELEAKARQGRAGLWRDENPVPPWEWRRRGRAKASGGNSVEAR